MDAAYKVADQALDSIQQDAQVIGETLGRIHEMHGQYAALEVANQMLSGAMNPLPKQTASALTQSVVKPKNLVVQVARLQRRADLSHDVYWEMLQGVIHAYLMDTGMARVIPDYYEAVMTAVQQSYPQSLICLINNNIWEWKRIEWAIEDGIISDQITYAAWVQSGRKFLVPDESHLPVLRRIVNRIKRQLVWASRLAQEADREKLPVTRTESFFMLGEGK